MTRRLDPIRAFDALGDEESRLIGSQEALRQAVLAAERAVSDAESARVRASADHLRGRGDDRAAAAQAEQDAHRALQEAKIAQAACEQAVLGLRDERAELVRAERVESFLPSVAAADENVRAAATSVIQALGRLRDAEADGAKAIDRLRIRDRQYGYVIGGNDHARLCFDAAQVGQWLAATVGGGLVWPKNLDRETGLSISQRELLIAAGIVT